jgi:hypothetical protein
MRRIKTKLTFFTLLVLVLLPALTGCSKLKMVKEVTESLQGDKLYFCERYVTKEIGEGSKFKAGQVTVMVKLKNPIGESSVDLNITDAASGKVVDTVPFNVQSSWDYIHFDNVEFKEPGKYKVSCLKKDGTVIVSGEVEII